MTKMNELQINLFDGKFVKAMADKNIFGKKCFFADSLPELRDYVNLNETLYKDIVSENDFDALGFPKAWNYYYFDPDYDTKYAYYVKGAELEWSEKGSGVWENFSRDEEPNWNSPNFEFRVKPVKNKWAEVKEAYYNGKTVQYKKYDVWYDCSVEPCWDDDIEFRIKPDDKPDVSKPERVLTNRELSAWLAQGYGEYTLETVIGNVTSSFIYQLGEENEEAPDLVVVRMWKDKYWHKPTVAYCYLNESDETQQEK